MSSFIKGLWSRTKKGPEVRRLDHPRSLQSGDLLQMSDSFGLPEQLRNQVLKVMGISTSQFEHSFDTTFSLQSQSDDSVYLTIEEEDGRQVAAFSFEIGPDVVEQIFDLDEFSGVFDGIATTLTAKDVSVMDGLIANQYDQINAGERGYYYDGKDYRGSRPPEFEGSGEPFDYFCLINKEETHAIEAEVYEGGETEVYLTLYRDINDIKDLWPAETT